MLEHIKISLRITVVLLVITCGLYPAIVWGIGQIAFRHQANGSLIERNGKVIGSEIIGQNFVGERYFHPRPSAAGNDGYDGTASGGTNLGPTSKKLLDTIRDRVMKYADTKPAGGVPADAVTASASGLDPHISPTNALSQASRVARAGGVSSAQIESMIHARTEGRFLGIYGEPRVNVLLLNLDLDEATTKR
ncbi:MAG TPA: K(+)-transporting ATPase subunit C [Thermoanaerobaculia bacterium]|jgi:K+-transporting ATPase ATPase C chain|nr:K(+)-transporting ATPase subunit C [Thermoanaerobaculia bacterium]